MTCPAFLQKQLLEKKAGMFFLAHPFGMSRRANFILYLKKHPETFGAELKNKLAKATHWLISSLFLLFCFNSF
jgi:hypothetical protein